MVPSDSYKHEPGLLSDIQKGITGKCTLVENDAVYNESDAHWRVSTPWQ